MVYRRLRPAIGTSFAFMMMYAALAQGISTSYLFLALGFMLIHLFGDCYNDYYDVGEDIRNKRTDKLILSGAISREKFLYLSFLILVAGLALVAFSYQVMLLPASWYVLLLFFYSHPTIRLKKYNIAAYLLGGSVWIMAFLLLEVQSYAKVSKFGVVFALFSFSQFVFILCQKDATDKKDTANLFLSRGRRTSFQITAFFGAFSSLLLFLISIGNIFFTILWILNALTKTLLLGKIRQGTITRSERGRLVLAEFLMPYLYIAGGLFA